MDEAQKKPTVGKVAVDLLEKADDKHTVVDQMRENLTDYDKNIWICVADGKKKYDGNFYIVVECKKERLLENVIRNYFFSRLTAPTPIWDQGYEGGHQKPAAKGEVQSKQPGERRRSFAGFHSQHDAGVETGRRRYRTIGDGSREAA